MNLATQAAEALITGNKPLPPLTPEQKQQWNGFVDYLEKTGYKGSSQLDNRNTSIGSKLIEQYRKANPSFTLTYDNIKDVQQDLQDYRSQMVDGYKKGKIVVDGIKSEDEIMPGLSAVDGWLGSKTSSWKFPQAVFKEQTMKGASEKSFGTDIAAYEAATQNYRKNK
jgi:hypothetical protein